MNASAFDDLAQACAAASRRRALKLAAATLFGGLAAAAARRGSTLVAQEGAPAATPVAEVPLDPAVDSGACTEFLLSGGSSPGDPIQVDDDLTVYLNDNVIFHDGDGSTNVMPPLPFQAVAGDQLTVVARDATACGRKIGALWLHCSGGGEARFLTGGVDDGCDEGRPAPENFFREAGRI